MTITPELVTSFLFGLAGLITVFVSFRIANTAAKRSSFEELQQVVDRQDKTIERLDGEIKSLKKTIELLDYALIKERARSLKWEEFAMKLNNQLVREGHPPIPFEPEKQVLEKGADQEIKNKAEKQDTNT